MKKKPKWIKDFEDFLVNLKGRPIEEIWNDIKIIIRKTTGQIQLFGDNNEKEI